MFNNGGNDIFTFPAQYEDSLDLYKGQQTGFVKGQIETQWGVVLDDYVNPRGVSEGSKEFLTSTFLA